MPVVVQNSVNRLLNNPHTSLAGVVWGLCKLGAIWLPQFKSQFEATEGVAVAYGLFMAGDSKPQNPTPGPDNKQP